MKKGQLMLMFSAVLAAGSMQAYAYEPGTYETQAAGRNGDVKLEVTFDEDEIVSIEAEHDETPALGGAAIDELIAAALEQQVIPTDGISGATLSSEAFKTALSDAVTQAGGDPAAMQAEEKETEAVSYETTADLVVVGGGAAGMTAAVTAANQGVNVILLEKSGSLGGNTLAAISGINAADSQVQLADEAYVEAGASVEGLEQLQAANEDARANLAKAYAENSAEVIDWFSDLGVEFTVEFREDPNNPYPNNYMLMAEEMGKTSNTLIDTVEKQLDNTNVIVYKNMEATQLTQEEDGTVTGVIATDVNGDQITFSAQAVLLATGGFGYNSELIAQVNPSLAGLVTDEIAPTTGQGLLMAQEAGAKAVNLGDIQTLPIVIPGYGMLLPAAYPGETGPGNMGLNALVVNQDAQRFAAETIKPQVEEILAQPESLAYMIIPEEMMNDALWTIEAAGFIQSGETAAELGEALGLDGEALQATVDAYNEDIADGTDDEFNRENPIVIEGTLYGFQYGIGAHYFMGGVLINEKTQVLDENEEPIPGLYAAGEVTGGFHGTFRVDGSGLGDSFIFGRIAGNELASALA